MKAVVSEKGQITIPKRLRDRLGLRPGQELDFTEDSGRLIAVKVAANDPFARASGILGCRRSSDEIVREVRGDPDAV